MTAKCLLLSVPKHERPACVKRAVRFAWDCPVAVAAIEGLLLISFGDDTNELDALVVETVASLMHARRPTILAGNGVRLAHATSELHRLIDRMKAPVLTTWKSLDLVADDDSLFAGRPGGIASRGANFTQQTADWILVLGARLDLQAPTALADGAWHHVGFTVGPDAGSSLLGGRRRSASRRAGHL